MLKKVQQYIEQHSLLNPADKIIVGVSGGADSCALIHLLLSLNYKCIIAHCNFHLRGTESMRDEEFVTQLAGKYNCVYHKIDFDTTAYAAQHNISIEMAARELRYNWFEKIRLEEKADYIAVAHHSDDVVETILMNLTRGTGINGLTGIKPKNGYIIRPLLNISRENILQYIEHHKLSFVTDSTNKDILYTRNRFRNKIIPLFEEINPSFSDNLLQTSERLNDVAYIYNNYIQDIKSQIVFEKNNTVHISIEALKKEKTIKSILFEITKEYGFNASQCADIIGSLDDVSGKQFFSSSYRLIKDRSFLLIDKTADNNETFEIQVNESEIKNPIHLQFEILEKQNKLDIETSESVAYFDFDKITFPLTLRHWEKGDVFYPLGMKNKKKVSDFFTDQKFSISEKEKTWLLLSGSEIIWIVGKRIDNRFKITPETKIIIKIIC